MPSLICVPGLGLDGSAWRPTIRALVERVPDVDVCVAALPGYGSRPVDGDDLRPVALGARLAAGWLAERSAPVVLMGHSASCQIVAHSARLAPEQVSALVLVGPTTDPRGASWPRIAARWLATAVWERPSQLPVLTPTYTRTGLLWMLRAMDAARHDDVRAPLREGRCPVLVARGRHDRICPEDWAQRLVGAAPAGSRAAMLEKGAHMVPLTHGDLLAAAVAAAVG